MIKTVGSCCSGIEAASVAWKELDWKISWFSEIAEFPSNLLATKYPNIPNLGDMLDVPEKIQNQEVEAPDLICGGTPCQAFSYAGWKQGLLDDRGNLTLAFVDVVDATDRIRLAQGKNRSVVLWENVEGVLSDKTNAFGYFLSSFAGLDEPMISDKWPNAGVIKGKTRNIAWRVIDAKYFGLPQQRRRLYVLAGGKNFHPESILFEKSKYEQEYKELYSSQDKVFLKEGVKYEVFREYTDVLYSSYGTKWNGNAAANNGSLFVTQDDRIRRLSPLECERLMGFPDDYTNIKGASRTARYQALGNSWAVPVIEWIGNRIFQYDILGYNIEDYIDESTIDIFREKETGHFINPEDLNIIIDGYSINSSVIPENPRAGNLKDIVDKNAPKSIYISPVGSAGILRRKRERNLNMNERLEAILEKTASRMSPEEIERESLRQQRGAHSIKVTEMNKNRKELEEKSNFLNIDAKQISLFDLKGDVQIKR